MDWQQLLTAQGGWAFSAVFAGAIARLVLKGELILRREFDRIVKEADKATTLADEAVKRQSVLSDQTISTQAELIKHLRKEGADQ